MAITPGTFVVRRDGRSPVVRVDGLAMDPVRSDNGSAVMSQVCWGVVLIDGCLLPAHPTVVDAYRPATEKEIAAAREVGELPPGDRLAPSA